jgi:hypothetical protein
MINKFRLWDKTDEVMIYPEDETVGKTGEWPYILSIGLHGLPVAVDKDSFKENEIIAWNVDHNRIAMRSACLKDRDDKEIWAGDIRVLRGKLYKVVDDGWRMVFERNLCEFGENHSATLDEDSAYESILIGNIHQNHKLLINSQ